MMELLTTFVGLLSEKISANQSTYFFRVFKQTTIIK